jgi:hypothetical protein
MKLMAVDYILGLVALAYEFEESLASAAVLPMLAKPERDNQA